METVLLGLAVGLGVGAVVGLVGAGGAIIAVPSLVYVVGLEPEEAVPTSLIVVGLASLAGAVPRLRRDVSWPLVLLIGAPGIPASWAGTAVGELLDPDWLMLCFALIMVVAGVRMLLSTRRPGPGARPAEHAGWGGLALRGIPVGLVVGFLTGLLGVGGGFLIIPALTLLLNVPMARAIGTSLVIIAVNSASGFAAHLDGLAIDWTLALSFAAMAMAASLAAARLAHRLNEAAVSRIFAAVIFTVALGVLVQTVPKLLPAQAAETREDGDAATLRPGGRVALPVELPEAVCEPAEPGFDAAVRLDLGAAGKLVVPAADPYRTVAEAHGQDCLQRGFCPLRLCGAVAGGPMQGVHADHAVVICVTGDVTQVPQQKAKRHASPRSHLRRRSPVRSVPPA